MIPGNGNFPPVWMPQRFRGQACRRTSRGEPFSFWTRAMPAIPISLLDCAVYLYPSVEDAEAGQSFGGSGFLLSVPMEGRENVATMYAVTCSHVIRPPDGSAGSPVVRLNTQDGGFEVLPLDHEAWSHHQDGDDLAIAPVGLSPDRHKFAAVPGPMLLRRERGQLRWCVPGTDTVMVGRFVTHEGRQRNTPTVRFGNVSMLPFEPIMSKRGMAQESFLVETRSLPGYSGSPVFGYVPLPAVDPAPEGEPPRLSGLNLRLLGVDWCHLPSEAKVLQPDGTPTSERLKVTLNSGMAGVVPAWKLTELLYDDEEVVAMREESERQWREEHPEPPAELDSAGDGEFERFEKLTRKLTNVPKQELDEKLKDEA